MLSETFVSLNLLLRKTMPATAVPTPMKAMIMTEATYNKNIADSPEGP